MANTLYYGDNLEVLRDHIASESVDLIYLDPPFNSNANYNILFKSPEGHDSDAQIEAFEDTWHWNDKAEDAFDAVMKSGNHAAFELLRAMRQFLGENDMMAYLAMMAIRLVELHRVLKCGRTRSPAASTRACKSSPSPSCSRASARIYRGSIRARSRKPGAWTRGAGEVAVSGKALSPFGWLASRPLRTCSRERGICRPHTPRHPGLDPGSSYFRARRPKKSRRAAR